MRRLSALLASLLLVGALAACGEDGGTTVTADPLAAVLAAPDKTVEAETAKVALDIEMAVEGEEITMTGEGVMSLTEILGRVEYRMSGLPGVGDVSMEQVMDGTTIFMRSDLFAQAPGLDTPWVSMDVEELSETAGVDISQLGAQQNDPTQTLAYLKGAADDVEEVGSENVRGTETTHYRATVDLRRAIENAGGITDREAFERVIDQIGDETVDMDVWIDGDGWARRMAYSMPMEMPQGELDIAIAMEFFDFGADVDVEAPPADQVTDLSELMGGAGTQLQQ